MKLGDLSKALTGAFDMRGTQVYSLAFGHGIILGRIAPELYAVEYFPKADGRKKTATATFAEVQEMAARSRTILDRARKSA